MNDEEKKLPPDRLWQPVTARWFFVIFGACLAYAIARYHIVGDVAWRHFPLFILNKAISLAAVIFIGASYLIGKIIHWYDHDAKLRLWSSSSAVSWGSFSPRSTPSCRSSS